MWVAAIDLSLPQVSSLLCPDCAVHTSVVQRWVGPLDRRILVVEGPIRVVVFVVLPHLVHMRQRCRAAIADEITPFK